MVPGVDPVITTEIWVCLYKLTWISITLLVLTYLLFGVYGMLFFWVCYSGEMVVLPHYKCEIDVFLCLVFDCRLLVDNGNWLFLIICMFCAFL